MLVLVVLLVYLFVRCWRCPLVFSSSRSASTRGVTANYVDSTLKWRLQTPWRGRYHQAVQQEGNGSSVAAYSVSRWESHPNWSGLLYRSKSPRSADFACPVWRRRRTTSRYECPREIPQKPRACCTFAPVSEEYKSLTPYRSFKHLFVCICIYTSYVSHIICRWYKKTFRFNLQQLYIPELWPPYQTEILNVGKVKKNGFLLALFYVSTVYFQLNIFRFLLFVNFSNTFEHLSYIYRNGIKGAKCFSYFLVLHVFLYILFLLSV